MEAKLVTNRNGILRNTLQYKVLLFTALLAYLTLKEAEQRVLDVLSSTLHGGQTLSKKETE